MKQQLRVGAERVVRSVCGRGVRSPCVKHANGAAAQNVPFDAEHGEVGGWDGASWGGSGGWEAGSPRLRSAPTSGARAPPTRPRPPAEPPALPLAVAAGGGAEQQTGPGAGAEARARDEDGSKLARAPGIN